MFRGPTSATLSRTLEELLPAVDPAQASTHLRQLHRGADGFVSLVLLGHGRSARACFAPVSWLHQPCLDPAASVGALQDVVDNHWQVYTACATFAQLPQKGRGTRGDVSTIPGVWADLDVKPDTEGYFHNEAELLAFRNKLLKPTIEVASGSGGRHLYWLVHPNQRLSMDPGENLLRRWRDYLMSQAGEWQLDHVHDAARILRLAGTVRWPRADDDDRDPHLVELIEDNGPRYHVENLETESELAWKQAEELRRELRASRYAEERIRKEWLNKYDPAFIAQYEADRTRFNMLQDWEPMLIGTGWTLHSDQRDGPSRCRYWTRPGKSAADGKSASTDWVDEEDSVHTTMTIYTRDPSLADLFDHVGPTGQVTCDKWTYALQRLYDGNQTALLADIVRNGGILP